MENDMTRGSISKILITFALPMLLGNIFQQLYNVVDIIIVGNFVGASALAAVGASSTIVMLLICIASGLSIGCSVLVSQYFGAGDSPHVKQSVYVSLVFILLCGAVMSAAGALLSGWLLRITRVPDEIFADGRNYLLIYSIGGIFLFAYNALAAMCRAVGDSKTPLYFLILTSLMNIGGDMLLVICFHLGVAGAALATAVSQAVSAVLCAVYIYRKIDVLRLHREDCVFDFDLLKDLIVYAIPSTIQQCIVSFSMVAVQGLVNTFGTDTIAGYTAACKIDQFAVQPLLSLNMAMTSFTAQNVGAGKNDRVRSGLKFTLLFSTAVSAAISLLIFFFGEGLLGLFVDSATNSAVIDAGMTYISVVSVGYFLLGWQFSFASVLRGAGDVFWFLLGSGINFGLRIAMAYILSTLMGYASISYSIIIGWIVVAVIFGLRYKTGHWETASKIAREQKAEESHA